MNKDYSDWWDQEMTEELRHLFIHSFAGWWLVICLIGGVDFDSAPTGYYYEPRYQIKLTIAALAMYQEPSLIILLSNKNVKYEWLWGWVMEYLIFLFPPIKESVGSCDYISNSMAWFYFLQYLFLGCSKTLAGYFNCGTTMVIGGPFYLLAGHRRLQKLGALWGHCSKCIYLSD